MALQRKPILGIFGREGLDMAARWTTPDASTPTYKAMKMYRNYDGNKSGFGDVSVAASAPNPDNVAAFAAQRTSDGALTVMLISKYLSGTTPATISLANFTGTGTAQVYQLTSANAIARLTDLVYSGTSLTLSAPAQSITLLVLPKAAAGNQPPVAVAAASPNSGTAPLTVTFSSTGSHDPDGTIASYSWNFGDGTTGTGAAPSHTYQTAGNYSAVLTVTDNLGATETASVEVSVTSNTVVVAAPSSLTATASRTTVALAWKDNSNNETGFYIERAASGSTTYSRIAKVGANVVKSTDTPARGTWVYRVQAYSGSTVSAYSNTASARIKCAAISSEG